MKEGDEVVQIEPEKVRFRLRELAGKGDISQEPEKSGHSGDPV